MDPLKGASLMALEADGSETNVGWGCEMVVSDRINIQSKGTDTALEGSRRMKLNEKAGLHVTYG